MTGAAPHGVSISVIVIAHFRRDFLEAAVQSVLSQPVPRSAYEVVVVKNFDDPVLDAALDKQGVVLVKSVAPTLAEKVAEGILQSHGRILTFLEDDDRFIPGKLGAVDAAFSDSDTLGYFHNGVRYIDANGVAFGAHRSSSRALRQFRRGGSVSLQGAHKGQALHQLGQRHPDFNCSSIAVSRTVALRAIPYLRRVKFAVDTLLFFVALTGPESLLVDDTVWTEYRLHGENLSTSTEEPTTTAAAKRLRHGELLRADYEVVHELAAQSGDPQICENADALLLMLRIYERLRTPVADRLSMVRDLGTLPRYRSTYPVRTNLLVALGSLLYPLAPGLAQRIYLREAVSLRAEDSTN